MPSVIIPLNKSYNADEAQTTIAPVISSFLATFGGDTHLIRKEFTKSWFSNDIATELQILGEVHSLVIKDNSTLEIPQRFVEMIGPDNCKRLLQNLKDAGIIDDKVILSGGARLTRRRRRRHRRRSHQYTKQRGCKRTQK